MSKSARTSKGRATESSATLRWILSGVGVLVVAGAAWWLFTPSTADLLDANELTPKQIYKVATELLVHEDPKIREKSSAKLTEQGAKAVPVLQEICLTHTDSVVRKAALLVVKSIDAGAAVAILDKLITDPDPEIRRVAANSAVTLDDPRSIGILKKAMNDQDTGVRLIATGGLGQKSANDSVAALERALSDQNISVRRHAARSLQNLTGRNYRDRVNAGQ